MCAISLTCLVLAQACKRQKVTAQSTMRPAGLPTALSNIGNSTHSSVVPPISALCNWQSDALLKNILNSITELQGRSEAERGSVAQQAEVSASLDSQAERCDDLM